MAAGVSLGLPGEFEKFQIVIGEVWLGVHRCILFLNSSKSFFVRKDGIWIQKCIEQLQILTPF